MSDSLWPSGLQHARLPHPSTSPRACSNSRPLSWWCHPTISSSVVPFSSCPQSLPPSGSFLMSQFFASGGQSIRASASASVLPMNIEHWFLLGLMGLISLLIIQGLITLFKRVQGMGREPNPVLSEPCIHNFHYRDWYGVFSNLTVSLTSCVAVSRAYNLLILTALCKRERMLFGIRVLRLKWI